MELLEKAIKMTNFQTEEAIERFSKRIRRMGLDEKLQELGVEEGDKIRILDFEFVYK